MREAKIELEDKKEDEEKDEKNNTMSVLARGSTPKKCHFFSAFLVVTQANTCSHAKNTRYLSSNTTPLGLFNVVSPLPPAICPSTLLLTPRCRNDDDSEP